MFKLFEDHYHLTNPYLQVARIAQESGDWEEAEAMNTIRRRIVDSRRKSRRQDAPPMRQNQTPSDRHLITYIPEISLARLFDQQEVRSGCGYESYVYRQLDEEEMTEQGEFLFQYPERTLRFEIKSRALYGRIENGWVELSETQLHRAERKMVDGFLFAAYNRRRGITYLMGYLLYDQLITLLEDPASHGIDLVRPGTMLRSGHTANRNFWRIPYAEIYRLPAAYTLGNFALADELAMEIEKKYPIAPPPERSNHLAHAEI